MRWRVEGPEVIAGHVVRAESELSARASVRSRIARWTNDASRPRRSEVMRSLRLRPLNDPPSPEQAANRAIGHRARVKSLPGNG